MALNYDDVDAQIDAYERRTGVEFSSRERASLRVLARQQPTERRPSRHPLGHDALPTDDQHTPQNRAALKSCLRAYWDHSLSDQINKHEDAGVGVSLADRFVTLLEIGCSLDVLLAHSRESWLLLVRRLRDNWTVLQLCQDGHFTPATYYRREADGLDLLITCIWHDYLAC